MSPVFIQVWQGPDLLWAVNGSNKLNNLKSSIILIDSFFALFIFSCIRRKVDLPETKSWGTVSHRIADQVSHRIGWELKNSQGVLALGHRRTASPSLAAQT